MYILKKKFPIIHKDQNISEAITRISKSKIKILFVISKNNKLIGSISSGDLRRSIRKKADLNQSVEKIMFKNPKYFKKKADISRSLKDLICVPIVTIEKRLLICNLIMN